MQRDPRQRDERYLAYIRTLPCCICGDNTSTEAAHLRVGLISASTPKRATGMGEKSSDKWALPLCSRHHREQHRMNELEFWASYGINPFELAISLRRPA
ncbi:DUF968 domain-containing protein [Bradyrhizobium sp. 1(2017)]|jgi:hypothetical protein|uniref:DUF968 domain-containing protein n=1 Tax=Bradyrhizobium sp. 1(2017) TaxID=1404888 RepID=UPI00140F05BF|nr:DUF968 domain-containing protein [Bradyrhizobium sp. 1(2017)]QIO34348.1 DUF968 domain-containing protein [Bradyrhizobium sp. 1(2017)]